MVAATQSRRPIGQKPKGPIDPSVGRKVRKLRLLRGMTQSSLAQPDFTKAFISHLETGRTRASLRAAGLIAQRLGVPVTELLATPAPRDQALVELRLMEAERELGAGRVTSALELARSVRPPREGLLRAKQRRAEGRALLQLGRPQEAVPLLQDAVSLFANAGQQDLHARALFDLAYAHASLDAPGEALTLVLTVDRALADRTIVDRTLELQVQSLLAGIYGRIGDLVSADQHATKAAQIAEDVVDPTALETLYATLLTVRERQGDLEGALVYARKGVELQESAGRERAAGVAWSNVAWVWIQRQQFSRAESALARGDAIAKRLQDARLTAQLHLTRARMELARRAPARAKQLAAEAAAIPEARPALRAAAALVSAQATAASGARLPAIRAAFERALRAHSGEPVAKIARVHELYGDALARAGRGDEAYRHAQKARALERRTT